MESAVLQNPPHPPHSPHPSDSDFPIATAPRVCLSCQRSKRKCDKILTGCMNCAKLGRRCRYQIGHGVDRFTRRTRPSDAYNGPFQEMVESMGQGRPLLSNSIANDAIYGHSLLFRGLSHFPDSSMHDPYGHPASKKAIVNLTLLKEVSKIVGTVEDIKTIALEYFSSIHQWMPVISKKRFYARIPDIWLEPNAGFILLAFCMFLVMQIPSEDPLQSMQSALYTMAKGLIALVESANNLSIEVIQSRLLVVLYEMSHGINPQASISLGACARHGTASRLHETLRGRRMDSAETWMEYEEKRRAWWSIVIFDRFVNLDTTGFPLATSDPVIDDALPADDGSWDINVTSSSESMLLSTSTSTRVSCFARQAQVSHVLGRVYRHVHDTAVNAAFHQAEALQLYRTLEALTRLLPSEAVSAAGYGAALGMCYSARLLFERSPFFSETCDHEGYRLHTLELINKSAQRVIDVYSRALREAAPGGPSPFGAHALYHATILNFTLAQGQQNSKHSLSVDLLRSALKRMNRRWRVAGAYLRALENLGADVDPTPMNVLF